LLTIGGLAAYSPGALAQGKKEMANENYRDARWGFEFTPFDKWNLTPPQPTERYMIVKFISPMPAIDPKILESFQCEIEVFRFDSEGRSVATLDQGKDKKKPEGPTTGGDGEPELKKLEDDLAYKSYDQFVRKAYSGMQMLTPKPEPIKAGKLTGQLYRWQGVFVGAKSKTQVCAAVFTNPEEKSQIVLQYTMAEFKFDEWKDWFKRSWESFKFIKKANDNPDRFNGLSPIDADRLRHREECERTGWKFTETPHFFIKYDVDKEDFIKEIKEKIEGVRKEYVKYYGDFDMTEIPVLRIVKNSKEYAEYGGHGGGQWSSATKELIVPCYKETDQKQTWIVLNHEGFHQFIYYKCGKVDPHSWYNEGTGDYYGGYRLMNGKFELKPLGSWAGGFDRVTYITEGIKKGTYVPLEKIFRWSQSEYYSGDGILHYSEGWSIVYFLREAKKMGHNPWKPEWSNILPEYERVLFETKDPSKAIESALKDVKGDKMKELEDSWKAFCQTKLK
jgi:hypothetical protein